MRKSLLFIAALFFTSFLYAQADLSFCTFVNTSNHECVFSNTKFITTPDSTRARLFMLLRSTDSIGTTKLTFKIFGIDRFGNEVYLNSVIQDIQSSWMSAWQPYFFTSPGKYMIKVYRDEEHMITSKGFEFFNY